MSSGNYTLRYFSCDGNYLGNFDVYADLEFGRQKNEIGVAELLLPNLYDISLFDKDSVLEIWRYNERAGRNELIGDTCWFLRKMEHCLEDGCKETTLLSFRDTMELLRRRVNTWFDVKRAIDDANPSDDFVGDYPSALFDFPDTIIDRLFYHNFIPAGTDDPINDPSIGVPFTADSLHDLLDKVDPATGQKPDWGISMENLGVFTTRDNTVTQQYFSFSQGETVLEMMQEVAEAFENLERRDLWFDIIYTPSTNNTQLGSFNFKVFLDQRGVNHSTLDNNNSDQVIVFGPEYNNLADPCLVFDWEEEASCIFAASGSADNNTGGYNNLTDGVTVPLSAAAATVPERDRCPFYPIEAYVADDEKTNPTNTDGDGNAPLGQGSIASIAEAEARRRSAIHTFTGTLVQSDATRLFLDYDYGDLVNITWKGFGFVAAIKKFMVTVTENGEEVTVPLEGNSFTAKNFLP